MPKKGTAGQKEKSLNDKQKLFVANYLRCWNGAKAARDAGYSARSAREQAYDLLTNPLIRAEIEAHLKQAVMSADEVLARLSAQASANVADLIEINADGFASFDFSTAGATDKLHAIKKLKTKRTRRIDSKKQTWEDESVEVELYDSQRALEMLGRYHNLFTEKDDEGKPLTDEQRIARVIVILDAARARRDGQTPTADKGQALVSTGTETPGGST